MSANWRQICFVELDSNQSNCSLKMRFLVEAGKLIIFRFHILCQKTKITLFRSTFFGYYSFWFVFWFVNDCTLGQLNRNQFYIKSQYLPLNMLILGDRQVDSNYLLITLTGNIFKYKKRLIVRDPIKQWALYFHLT